MPVNGRLDLVRMEIGEIRKSIKLALAGLNEIDKQTKAFVSHRQANRIEHRLAAVIDTIEEILRLLNPPK